MTVEQLISRLLRELEVVVSLQDISKRNADRYTRLGFREVAAFESGYESAFEYTRFLLNSVILDYDVSELPQDG